MFKKNILLLAILTGTAISSYAQVPPIEWDYKTLPNVPNIYALDQRRHDSSLVVTSAASAISSVVYGNRGQLFSFYPNSNVIAKQTKQLPSGDFLTVGIIQSGFSASTNDAWVAKFDSAFNLLWEKRYGGSQSDQFDGFEITDDGGFTIWGLTQSRDQDLTGYHTDSSYIFSVGWAVELDASGNILWQKTAKIANFTSFHRVHQEAGPYLLTGVTRSAVTSDNPAPFDGQDYWAALCDTAGDYVWRKNYGGSGSDGARYGQLSTDNNLMLIGTSSSTDNMVHGTATGTGGYVSDIWVVKINPATGDTLWARAYGGAASESFPYVNNMMAATSDGGGVFVASYASDTATLNVPHMGQYRKGNADYWVVKFDANGNLQWHKIMGSTGNDTPYGIIEAQEGGYLIAGTSGNQDGDVTPTAPLAEGPWIVKLKDCPAYRNIEDVLCKGNSYLFVDSLIATTGTYRKVLHTYYGCDSIITLTLVPGQIDKPIILINGNTLSTGTYNNYQWLDAAGNAIPGATNRTYQPVNPGPVRVAVYNSTGCSDTSDVFDYLDIAEPLTGTSLRVYPNPADDRVHITLQGHSGIALLTLQTVDGRTIQQHTVDSDTFHLDLSQVPSGMYMIRITATAGTYTCKIVKQ